MVGCVGQKRKFVSKDRHRRELVYRKQFHMHSWFCKKFRTYVTSGLCLTYANLTSNMATEIKHFLVELLCIFQIAISKGNVKHTETIYTKV